jgi:tetratricopeptide (TPR) repeat protein
VGGPTPVIYVLVAAIVALVAGIGVLLFSGDLFDPQPSSKAERDYLLLVEGLQENPENPVVLMALAETEMELGREDDAAGHALQAFELGEDVPGIPQRYAQIMLAMGDDEAALVGVQAELEIGALSSSPEPYFIWAQILRSREDLDGALEKMEQALAVEYMAADIRIVYADMLAEAGREDDAIDQYQEALRFLPGDDRAISGLEALGVSVEATQGVNPHGTTEETDG